MARPRKNIDLELVEKLALIHCKNTEIAAFVGCDESLLRRGRFSEIIRKAREKGKISLRRKMFETAMAGNVVMQIWLSKNLLGFTDKVEERVETVGPPAQIVVTLPAKDVTPLQEPKDP